MSPRKLESMSMVRLTISSLLLFGLFLCCVAQEPEEESRAAALLSVKRICVEKISGDGTQGAQAQEMAFASLFASKRFVLTENCEKADAVIKGAVTETTDQRVRAEAEDIEFGKAVGAASASLGSGTAAVAAAHGGASETLASSETRRQVSVSLRIVDKDGEVLWAHTQESGGGKVKGPLADAVDRAVKQLVRDIEKAEKSRGQSSNQEK